MDRSPCGTGTTAKMTLLHHQGKLDPGQLYKNAGPLGTVFEGQIVKTVAIGESFTASWVRSGEMPRLPAIISLSWMIRPLSRRIFVVKTKRMLQQRIQGVEGSRIRVKGPRQSCQTNR
jgi:hypothetical protein